MKKQALITLALSITLTALFLATGEKDITAPVLFSVVSMTKLFI